MVCLSHFGLINHVSFQNRLYLVYVYDDITDLVYHTVLIDRVTEKSLQTTRKSEKQPFLISQLCKENLLILSCV